MIRNALSFTAVIKAGSFSKASKVIGLSKAQLSRHVSELEKQLGIQLLYRTTRKLLLTESGRIFFESCLEIEKSYDMALDKVTKDNTLIKGPLRITAPISFGSELLLKIINNFVKKYPNINITLSLNSVTEDLIENNYDIALRVASALPNSNLRMKVIHHFDMVLCASPDYFKNISHPNELEELKYFKFITPVNRNNEVKNIKWPFIINEKIVNYSPNSLIQVDSLRMQIELVLLGAGIGRAPRFMIKNELEENKLVEILAHIKQPKYHLYLLYPNRKHLPKKTKVFIDFLANSLANI